MTRSSANQIEQNAGSRPSSKGWFWRPLAAVALLTGYLVFLCFQWSYEAGRWNTRELSCRGNLRTLGLALYNYHDEYGSFPPAYIADENGKPMHSWRVLILPFIGQSELYDEYDFSEPWDGPNNRRLIENPPTYFLADHSDFRCPDDHSNAGAEFTNYVAVVGDHTAWRGDLGVSLSDVTDGIEGTIHLVEIKNTDIKWTEPRDLSFDEVGERLKDLAPEDFHLTSPGWFFQQRVPFLSAITVEGKIVGLPPSIDDATLKGLLTIDGNEDIRHGQLPIQYPTNNWKGFRLVVLPTGLFMLIAITIGTSAGKSAISVFGSLGALLGVVMPPGDIYPTCDSAEAYARVFESWTFSHVLIWGVIGLIAGTIFGVIRDSIDSRRDRRVRQSIIDDVERRRTV